MIEDALLTHPSVVAAAAVGCPDRHSGKVPVAYVVPADPDRFNEDALLAHTVTAALDEAGPPTTGRTVTAAHEDGRLVVTVTGADPDRTADVLAAFALTVRCKPLPLAGFGSSTVRAQDRPPFAPKTVHRRRSRTAGEGLLPSQPLLCRARTCCSHPRARARPGREPDEPHAPQR